MHSLSHTNCNYALLSLLLWYDQFQWCFTHITWWRHQMKTFSALLVLCAENSPVTGEFPSQGWVNNRDVGDLGAIVLIMASPYWFRVYLSRCQSSDGREIWVNLPALYLCPSWYIICWFRTYANFLINGFFRNTFNLLVTTYVYRQIVMDLDDKSDGDWFYFHWKIGIIFYSAGTQDIWPREDG